MDYFISDLHNMDKNIIVYEHRFFQDVEEMKEVMINNINKTVLSVDRLFILGDIGDSEILNYLKPEIVIVTGNHDNYDKLRQSFPDILISKYPIMLGGLWLSHEPITFMPRECPYLNIHGHLHSLIYGTKDRTWEGGNRYFNVSVEQINYTPISIHEIADRMDYS